MSLSNLKIRAQSRDDYPLSEWKKRSWIVLRGYAKTRSFSHDPTSCFLTSFGAFWGAVTFQILAVVLVTCIRVVARRRTPKFNW